MAQVEIDHIFWSFFHRKDAFTLLQDAYNDGRNSIRYLEAEVKKFDNVQFALNEGKMYLQNNLCQQCKDTIKGAKLSSPPRTKKKLKRLPSEYMQLLNEHATILARSVKLNRENQDDDEYGTPEECYQQELCETTESYTAEINGLKNSIADLTKELNSLKKRPEDEQTTKKELKFDLHKLQVLNKTNESTIRSKEQQCSDLQRQLSEAKHRNTYLQENISRAENEKEKMSAEVKSLHFERQSLSKSSKENPSSRNPIVRFFSGAKDYVLTDGKNKIHYQGTVDSEQQSLASKSRETDIDMQTLLEEKLAIRSKLNDQQANHEEQLTKYANLQQKNEILWTDMEKLKEEFRVNQTDKDNLEKELATVQMELKESSDRNEILQTEHSELTSKHETTQNEELKVIHADRHKLKEDLQKSDDRYEQLQTEFSEMSSNLDAKEDKLRKVIMQLKELQHSKRKSIVLGLRSERSGMGKAMVDVISKELTKRLQGRFDKDCIDLTVQPRLTNADSGPIVVLCLNMSRVGTNIQETLKGVKAEKNVIVLVVHNTNKENLPSLTPTSLRVTGSEFRQLGGILDIAFTSEGGLYDCDLNMSTFEKMATLLRKCYFW